MGSVCPPFEYLATCSEPGLESYELSRLNQASNLRRELRQLMDRWIECEVEARMARLTLESRRIDVRAAGSPLLEPQANTLPQQLRLPLLPPEAAVRSAEHRGNSQPHTGKDVPALRAEHAAANRPAAKGCPSAKPSDGCHARRKLQIFVPQQPGNSSRRQHTASGRRLLGRHRGRYQRDLRALRDAEHRDSSFHALKLGSFAIANDAALRLTAHASFSFPPPARHHQQLRQIPNSYARCGTPLDRQCLLPHAAESARSFCNDYPDPYSSLCTLQ